MVGLRVVLVVAGRGWCTAAVPTLVVHGPVFPPTRPGIPAVPPYAVPLLYGANAAGVLTGYCGFIVASRYTVPATGYPAYTCPPPVPPI